MTKEYTLYKLHQDIEDAWQDILANNDFENIEELLHEIADGLIPIYLSDLLELASNHLSFAIDEPECGPAYGGKPTPVNIISANVYEFCLNRLYELYNNEEVKQC